ncbi:site-specific integrase [Mesorhizobium sp. AD1-1]|uniref:tyrosine-type recombinase/integrase n=1 Tax=Mesorhizobium sp. AD1-1 TaxID=2876621 RepID=UPI001CCB325E|nr:site-specific integrase [Mesorhizobium sp. AD1-1]MBZ9718551.1 site-specific integrase [Mesorhizobium sp. AD1-1]
MAKRVRDAKYDSRAAREKLKARGDPYYSSIAEGLHVGYRKGKVASVWVMRSYIGDQNYKVAKIGIADDVLDADGVEVLNWWQAVDKARAILGAQREGPASPYTVGDALTDYLAHAKERQKAYRDTEITVEQLIRPEFDKVVVAELTTEKIRRWHNKLAATPPRLRTKKGKEQKFSTGEMDDETKRRRKSTANRVLTVLKAALNRAFREEKVKDDKAWRRVEAFEDVDSARIHYLKIPEAQRLINASEPDFRKLVQAALQTGCRYGELCRLKVGDFNEASGTVAVHISKTSQPRHIVLTDEGVAFFKSLTVGRGSGEIMLLKANGDAWAESHQSRPMLDACTRAKIDPPIGFHGLRHTWASLAVMNGVPLLVVAKNLGHVDTRMVERHYSHFAPSFAADAIRAGAPRFGVIENSNVTQI